MAATHDSSSKVLIMILLALLGGCLGQPDDPRLIDLTWTMKEGIPVYPSSPEYQFTIAIRGEQPGGYYLEKNNLFFSEHTGTHLDAPAHFVQGGWRLDQIPLGHLAGPAAVIDVREKTRNNPDYEISQQDLQDWEREHGPIPDNSILMLHTGWGEWYWDQGVMAYVGRNSTLMRFPGLQPGGARWLVNNRNVKVVGIDTLSPDVGLDYAPAVHQILLPNNILIIENMAHLDELPPTGFTVYAMPIKVGEGSGAPARVFAIIDDRTNAVGLTTPNFVFVVSSVIALILAFM